MSSAVEKPKVIAIVGPTASGKTSLSIEIATHFDGEVVSADSRQVYRGLDIGTGKVTQEETRGVPHHLIDIVEPTVIYTGANFKQDATVALIDIFKRGKNPIVAGGTFFYLDLLRGRRQTAPVAPNLILREGLRDHSTNSLMEKLRDLDPKYASKIDPHNRHRLIRALEVATALGQIPKPVPENSAHNWLVIGLDIPTDILHRNIHDRLLERMNNGMLEEATRLHANGLTFERMENLGLEYRYLSRYLRGLITLDEMTVELETKIKQFAKRQLTWLKQDKSVNWQKPQDIQAVLGIVAEFLHAPTS